MTRCSVQGLLEGGCYQTALFGEALCYYHDKLKRGLTKPPGDQSYFLGKADEYTDSLAAVLAYGSYAGSTHSEFADLIDTGGISFDLAAA